MKINKFHYIKMKIFTVQTSEKRYRQKDGLVFLILRTLIISYKSKVLLE